MLEGIRVVEMGVWVAGPAAGGILADWGADVVKVEAPAGDPMRGFFQLAIGSDVPHNPPFDLDNRGKRSVVLDLTTDAGRAALEKLLADADVFVTNMRPAALERLGMSHAEVTARHPRLIYASITGYGLEGEDRDRAGYDVGAFWARSGAADLFRVKDDAPLALRGGFGDHVTGIAAVAGILGALIERGRTGRGRLVETSLLRTGMYCLGWDLGIQLVYDKLRGTLPRTESDNPMVNCYRAGDGAWFWLIGLEGDRHFPLLCGAVERLDLLVDQRFASARARRMNRRELISILDSVFAGSTRDQLAKSFDREGVWWVPVQTPAEAVRDPQALANGVVCEVQGGEGRDDFRAIASPVGFRDGSEVTPPPRLGAVPALGADTAAVLREAGLEEATIATVLAALQKA
ncbi:MAG: CaiB/BaiF CoA transferase family protein [Candidatus Binatia bacterium]